MKHKYKWLCGLALISAATFAGCAAIPEEDADNPAWDEEIVAPGDSPVDGPAETPEDHTPYTLAEFEEA